MTFNNFQIEALSKFEFDLNKLVEVGASYFVPSSTVTALHKLYNEFYKANVGTCCGKYNWLIRLANDYFSSINESSKEQPKEIQYTYK